MTQSNAILSAGVTIAAAVLLVGFADYRQDLERDKKADRWLEVCESRMASIQPIDTWDDDYLYITCYRYMHGAD
jgi:hypothetical protein